MNKYILTCSCYGMEKKARQAFSVIFPNELSPDVIKGKDRIYKFAKSLTPQNDHLLAIAKLSGKFAYYVEIDENNKIITEYDLIRGTRIK